MSTKILQIAFLLVAASTLCNAQLLEPENTNQNQLFDTRLGNETKITVAPSTLEIGGRILDDESGYPVSYATIGVGKLGLGTVSNIDGDWTLKVPAKSANEKLSIRCLGYTTQEILVSKIVKGSVIHLKQVSYELGEVVVGPDTLVKYILNRAYKEIKSNYPEEPSLTQGFYRETQRTADSLFLYFNEAVLNVYKNTYKNTSNFGQIEVEKSRKNVFPGIDSLNDVRFYAGPHFPNDLDIVFSRWTFIRPSEYKNWRYELEGMYMDSISNVYTITFYNRKMPNTEFRGKMFIDANTYAYLGFELRRAGINTASSAATNTGASYIPGNTIIKIGYTEKEGLQYLSYINYKTNGLNTTTKTRIYKDIEYITTSIKTDTVKPIPFNRQFDYYDILSIKAENYDQSYWKDYNILQESKMMNKQTNLIYGKEQATEQLTRVYNKELTQEEKIMLFLKRFTFDGGVAYNPYRFISGLHLIGYGTDPVPANYDQSTGPLGKDIKSNNFGLSTMDGIRFELNKNFSLFGTISTALYGMEQVQGDLGLNYRLSVFPRGRWVFLDLGVAGSAVNSKFSVTSISNPENNLNIDGKSFDSRSINVKVGNSGAGAKGYVGISVRMGKKYELFVDGSYYLPLIYNKKYVQFKEASGPLFGKKSSKVDWDDPNLFYYIGNQKQTTPAFEVDPYHFRFGIRSGF